ncbi:MAG: hypothetical protein IPO32_15190 [Crocinitomicaceae bacterium]|jgi:hypothetical protein|nr:hypothetical protein [Crocinitomicaceae bacterium]MBK6950619.1 hypothetical protein [Crocinitomicaceae bacterium]MBK9592774.1 hypothetical protein [Crocinitomicaceae bacterium]
MASIKSSLSSIGKTGSGISFLALIYAVISSFALEDAGFIVAIVIAGIASTVALISIATLLVKGEKSSPFLILLLVANIILILIYSVIIFYIFFVLPAAVNEMMNGG